MTHITTEQLNALVNSNYFGPELKAAFGKEADDKKTQGDTLEAQAKAVYGAIIGNATKNGLETDITKAKETLKNAKGKDVEKAQKSLGNLEKKLQAIQDLEAFEKAFSKKFYISTENDLAFTQERSSIFNIFAKFNRSNATMKNHVASLDVNQISITDEMQKLITRDNNAQEFANKKAELNARYKKFETLYETYWTDGKVSDELAKDITALEEEIKANEDSRDKIKIELDDLKAYHAVCDKMKEVKVDTEKAIISLEFTKAEQEAFNAVETESKSNKNDFKPLSTKEKSALYALFYLRAVAVKSNIISETDSEVIKNNRIYRKANDTFKSDMSWDGTYANYGYTTILIIKDAINYTVQAPIIVAYKVLEFTRLLKVFDFLLENAKKASTYTKDKMVSAGKYSYGRVTGLFASSKKEEKKDSKSNTNNNITNLSKEKSFFSLNQDTNNGSVKAMLNSGDSYAQNHIEKQNEKPNNQKAFEWYNKATDKGDSDAMNHIGFMYMQGCIEKQNEKPNYQKAFKWYNIAANNGSVEAMFNIGSLYANGQIGGKKNGLPNYQEAFEWYNKAANNGLVEAMFNLGEMYKQGCIDKQDEKPNYDKAAKWFEQAANNGSVEAMLNLGFLYAEGHIGGKDSQPNYQEAFKWYNTAANKESVEAMFNLGFLYAEGHIGGKDSQPNYQKAFEWYNTAANNGSAEAMYNLGILYFKGHIGGKDGQPNYDEAAQWYNRATDKGNSEAMYNLGFMYMQGCIDKQDEKPNYDKALEWFNHAIENGHNTALEAKDVVLEMMSKYSKDTQKNP